LVNIGAGVGLVVETPVKLKCAPATGHAGLNVTSSCLILTVFICVLATPIAQVLAGALDLYLKFLFQFFFRSDHFYALLWRQLINFFVDLLWLQVVLGWV